MTNNSSLLPQTTQKAIKCSVLREGPLEHKIVCSARVSPLISWLEAKVWRCAMWRRFKWPNDQERGSAKFALVVFDVAVISRRLPRRRFWFLIGSLFGSVYFPCSCLSAPIFHSLIHLLTRALGPCDLLAENARNVQRSDEFAQRVQWRGGRRGGGWGHIAR